MKKFSEIFKAPEALRRRRAIVEPPLKLYPETIISSVKTRAVKVRAVKIGPAEPAPELKRLLDPEPFRLRSYDSGAIEAPGANNLNGSGVIASEPKWLLSKKSL